MKNRNLLMTLTAVALLGIACTLALTGCKGGTQAALDASQQQIKQAQDRNTQALADAKAAYDHAVAINDTLAAQLNQAKIDAANKQAKDLATAQALHDAAQAAADAKTGSWQDLAQTVVTIGGLLPPPFNLIGLVGGALVAGGVFGNKKGLATGGQALSFQAAAVQHAQTPGVTAGDVATHIETAKSNLSAAAARLYDAAPAITIPLGPTAATGTVAV